MGAIALKNRILSEQKFSILESNFIKIGSIQYLAIICVNEFAHFAFSIIHVFNTNKKHGNANRIIYRLEINPYKKTISIKFKDNFSSSETLSKNLVLKLLKQFTYHRKNIESRQWNEEKD